MERYGSVRAAALGFGVTYLVGGVLLSDLVGSTADSTGTFTAHFDNDARRFGDIAGSILLLASSFFLVAAGLTLRQRLVDAVPSLRTDLVAALAVLGAAGLVVSAGLLLAVPLMQSVGDLFSDPGMEPAVAAGIAQAGVVVLLATLIVLGAFTALVAQLSRGAGATPRWFLPAGWTVAVLTLLGITGAAAFPLGLWWVALAFGWRDKPLGAPREAATPGA